MPIKYWIYTNALEGTSFIKFISNGNACLILFYHTPKYKIKEHIYFNVILDIVKKPCLFHMMQNQVGLHECYIISLKYPVSGGMAVSRPCFIYAGQVYHMRVNTW